MLNVSQSVENFLKEIEDPVTLAPYVNAVTLVTLGGGFCHNLGEETALTLFGAMRDSQVERPGKCPVCRKHVVSYGPNHTLRNLISQIQMGAATILPQVAQRMAEEPLSQIPFIGKKASLACCGLWGKWTDGQNASITRKIEFRSVTPNSFLDRMTIYGLVDNSINVVFKFKTSPSITLNRNKEVFANYISKLGLLKVDSSELSCVASLPRELDWALKFLTEDNGFCEEDQQELPFVRRLLQDKQWQAAEQEMRPLRPSRPSPATPATPASPAPQAEAPPPAYVAPEVLEAPPPAYEAVDEAPHEAFPAHVAPFSASVTSSSPPPSSHVAVAQVAPSPEQRLSMPLMPPKPPRLPSRSPAGRPVQGAQGARVAALVSASASHASSSPSPSLSTSHSVSPLPAGLPLSELMAHRARVLQPKADYRVRGVREDRGVREQKNGVEEVEG